MLLQTNSVNIDPQSALLPRQDDIGVLNTKVEACLPDS